MPQNLEHGGGEFKKAKMDPLTCDTIVRGDPIRKGGLKSVRIPTQNDG